jgi:hypothetical protein
MNNQDIYTRVGERYGSAAKGSNVTYSTNVAKAFGYSNEDLDSIPKDANLGLSCGTPLAIASLKEVGPVSTVLQKTELTFLGRDRYRPGKWCWTRCIPLRQQNRPDW